MRWTSSRGLVLSSFITVQLRKRWEKNEVCVGDRRVMIEAGIVSSLLELTLVGTTLAQKRASRILECLRIDKGKQVSGSYGGNFNLGVSAPICGSSSSSSKGCLVEEDGIMSEGKEDKKVQGYNGEEEKK